MIENFNTQKEDLPSFTTVENEEMSFENARAWIEEIAYQAGQMLLQEFHAVQGPRGSDDKAMIDREVELFLKDAIHNTFPTHGIYAEEDSSTNKAPQNPQGYTWHIDPNDGTAAYLKMYRGSSLSIALSYKNEPIFGIVYAYAFPNDQGDFISGGHPAFGPMKRNGHIWKRADFPSSLKDSIVAISQASDRKCSLTNSELCAPARCISVPSIAYRLALVAVGDADVGVSLAAPGRLDCWAGLALLKSLGACIVSNQGTEIDFFHSHGGALILGGPLHLTSILAKRTWQRVYSETNPAHTELYDLLSPQKSLTLPLDQYRLLARAQGVFVGQCAGDALGSLVEFQSPSSIKNAYPQGVHTMHDGGTFNTIAGQVTDDTEMALTLARSLIEHGHYHEGIAAMGYAAWLNSHPFDLGNTTAKALSPVQKLLGTDNLSWDHYAITAMESASQTSQANGALMRIAPFAIFAAGSDLPLDQIAELAKRDARLTHPHPICQDVNAVYVVAIVEGIRTQHTAHSLYQYILTWAEKNNISSEVLSCLRKSETEYLPMYPQQIGWVLRAFQGAFYMLLHSTSLAEGIQRIVEMGGDTDTNGAITGALLGCIYGVNGIPQDWLRHVCSNRPIQGLAGVHRPRPRLYWTCDVLRISEQLLCASSEMRSS